MLFSLSFSFSSNYLCELAHVTHYVGGQMMVFYWSLDPGQKLMTEMKNILCENDVFCGENDATYNVEVNVSTTRRNFNSNFNCGDQHELDIYIFMWFLWDPNLKFLEETWAGGDVETMLLQILMNWVLCIQFFRMGHALVYFWKGFVPEYMKYTT